MSTATCECNLPLATIANMTADQHRAAHNEDAAPWVTFTTFKLYGRTHLVQKRNGSSRTVVA